MKDFRLLQAAIRRRAQEELMQRGIEIKRARTVTSGNCATCGCTLRLNAVGYSWCTQTRKHGALS